GPAGGAGNRRLAERRLLSLGVDLVEPESGQQEFVRGAPFESPSPGVAHPARLDDALRAGVPLPVVVGVGLIEIGQRGTVVAGVADPVAVAVLLTRVGDVG